MESHHHPQNIVLMLWTIKLTTDAWFFPFVLLARLFNARSSRLVTALGWKLPSKSIPTAFHVLMAGLEPARDFSHQSLKLTRLPKLRHTSIYIYVQMNDN